MNQFISLLIFFIADCPAGQYFSNYTTNYNSECVACPVGFYKTDVANEKCTECGDGTTTPSTGSTLSSECGQYSNNM